MKPRFHEANHAYQVKQLAELMRQYKPEEIRRGSIHYLYDEYHRFSGVVFQLNGKRNAVKL